MNCDSHSIKVRTGERKVNDSSHSVEVKSIIAGGTGFVPSMHLFSTK